MVLASDGTGGLIDLDGMSFKALGKEFKFHALPEVTESKTAQYSDVLIIGRSSPLKTYAGSDHRALSVTFHLHGATRELHSKNLEFIRTLNAMLYPRYDQGYSPPPIGFLTIGSLVNNYVVCTSINIPYNTDTAWIATDAIGEGPVSTWLPLHIPVQADFHTVYAFAKLPGASDVIKGDY